MLKPREVMAVIELIDNLDVLDALADQARGNSPPPLAEERAKRARSALVEAIRKAREVAKSPRLKSIRKLRTDHVAHYMSEKVQEKDNDVPEMKHGDEGPVIEGSITIVEALNSYVNNVGMSFKDARAIDRKCAESLWNACTFDIETG